jgi:hypothetical protein
MNDKTLPINPKEKFTSRTSLAKCREILEADKLGYTDEEVIMIRDFVHCLAKMIHDYYLRCVNSKQDGKVININTFDHDKKESDYLCTGEHRRAS